MSAALNDFHAAAPMPPPIDVDASESGEAPARRLSGSHLFRLLNRVPSHRRAFCSWHLVPYRARPVLEAICRLSAEGSEPGILRPSISCASCTARLIAAELGQADAVDEVQADLEALGRAGMLTRLDDGGVRLEVDLAAATTRSRRSKVTGSTRSAPSARSTAPTSWGADGWRTDAVELSRANWKDRGGRPAPGETSEDATERRFQVAVKARQMPPTRTLSLVSVLDGGEALTSQPNLQPNCNLTDQVEVRLGCEVAARVQSTVPAAAAAAAIEYNQLNHTDKQQQQQQICTTAARARQPNPTSQPATSEVRPVASAFRPEAITLANEGIQMFGWTRKNADAAPAIMDGYLAKGYSVVLIREAMAARRGYTVNGALYFEDQLKDLAAAKGPPSPTTAPSSAQSATPAPGELLHVGVNQVPEWGTLGRKAKVAISRLLKVLDMPPSQDRWCQADSWQKLAPLEFSKVATRRPELLRIVEDGPSHGRDRAQA